MNSEFKFFRRSNMTANQIATQNGSCQRNGMQQRVIPSKFASFWGGWKFPTQSPEFPKIISISLLRIPKCF